MSQFKERGEPCIPKIDPEKYKKRIDKEKKEVERLEKDGYFDRRKDV